MDGVVIPESVTTIESGLFYKCTGLTSITIPESVTTIYHYAFRGCTGLTSITIPESVYSICQSTFEGCNGLTAITIPESVVYIGPRAFAFCSNLTSITIPKNVTYIEYGAFEGNTKLTAVYYNADTLIEFSADIFSEETYEKATLYLSDEGLKLSQEVNPWKNFKGIKEYDFSGINEAIVDFDEDAPYEVYNISGMKVGDSIEALAPGLYIVRQANKIKKIIVQ